jgi:hypothetical protein
MVLFNYHIIFSSLFNQRLSHRKTGSQLWTRLIGSQCEERYQHTGALLDLAGALQGRLLAGCRLSVFHGICVDGMGCEC